ncbi:diguanylate cyclase [Geobacter sp. FeAm09]|uniref:GGDEF domain-containing protein n=1 Tax=Geobacter sp. FeAm09 TaxID=2597769 RepID=UPI0011EBDD5E|nr:diguanylate cyclase [Geobacter sp. FeAm09]QEM67136.1 diguanylate cyclase [Geobacter sp. FeAm09]
MPLIFADEMFVGETAEVVSLSETTPEIRQLKNMGLREGKLIDLLYYDPLASRKAVIAADGTRLAFDAGLAAHIMVRPIKEHFEIIRDMAHYDNLTGCLNRHAAGTIMRSEVERFSREGLPLALLMADLDHFKTINDTYGHEAGDSVLKRFCDLTRQGLRRSDLLCRWGGEEFLILLRGTLAEEAQRIAERFRERVAAALFPPFDRCGLVTVSIGGAAVPPGKDFARLVADADAALYRAKREGRNRVALC